MNQSQSITKLAAALVAAQGEIKAIVKDSVNPHYKNKYASLDTLTEAVRPILTKHKLALVQGATVPHTDENGTLHTLNVETMLLHESGEWLSNVVIMPVDKPSAQGAGSAVTYGRRYGLGALLALTTDEDDDGQAASQPRAKHNASGRVADALQPNAQKPKPAAEKVMPFGKTKGTKLGDMSDTDLEAALNWCRETDAEKFASLITALEEVLEDRRLAAGDDYEGVPF